LQEGFLIYQHKWKISDYKTPSGKLLFYCPRCKLYDPAPVKEKYENRPCKLDLYEGKFAVMPAGKGENDEHRQGNQYVQLPF